MGTANMQVYDIGTLRQTESTPRVVCRPISSPTGGSERHRTDQVLSDLRDQEPASGTLRIFFYVRLRYVFGE